METHFASEHTVSSACVAVGNIAAAEHVFPAYAETKFKVSASILDNAIKGMHFHESSAVVQTRCAFAIGAICRSSATLQRHATRFLGAPTLLAAMSNFKDDSSVQWRAAFAITNVVSLNPAAREIFGTKAVGAILSAMRQFPKDTRLQRWCCESLYNLLRGSKENVEACTSQGGVETVLRAMKLDKSDAALVARADDLINVLWEF
jgi:hypothetical protein